MGHIHCRWVIQVGKGETARESVGPDWGSWAWLGLGWACEKNELGRGPLAEGWSGSGAAAATAVVDPGRRDEGRNGRGRWLWTPPALRRGRYGTHRSLSGRNRGVFAISADFAEIAKIAIWGLSRPARIAGSRRGSWAAGERCPAYPVCPNLCFCFFLN
ncbi:hypothetical protein CRG98_036292 [Punica granatum]|uniref:Uncharacterized protein n=1 Tax=Punica granatum TaxID=22663 RepID=A0A2I0IH28_PUNGR|nr:hypothetical protein CRG98_036292 [Punica granatum]